MHDLVIAGGSVLYCDQSGPVDFRPGTVCVNGDRITAIEPPDAVYEAKQVLHAQHKAVLPGFVNGHTHVAAGFYRGVIDDWSQPTSSLHAVGFPVAASLDAEEYYWLAMLGVLETVKAGATTLNDLYHHSLVLAKVVDEVGVRAVISQKIVDIDLQEIEQGGYERKREIGERRLEQNIQLVEEWHGGAGGRITCRFGPTTCDTNSEDLLRRVKRQAQSMGVGLHIHLAEAEQEMTYIQEHYGCSPVEYLEQIGFLGPDTMVVHLTFAAAGDLEILRKNGCSYACTPPRYARSGHFPPLVAALRLGIPVALGTDWIRMDMWEAYRQCVSSVRLMSGDERLLSAAEVLDLGTRGAARALGLEREVGVLAPGYKADIVVVDMDKPHLQPFWRTVPGVVYAADRADVDTVVVDGRVIVSGGRITTVDEAAVLREVRRLQPRIEQKLRRRVSFLPVGGH